MIISSTTVRPYTKAIFTIALRDQKLAEWQVALKLLALVAEECQKKELLNNPMVGRKQELEFFSDVSKRFPAAANLIQVLAERKKLDLLPSIATGYQRLLFEHQNTLEAQVISTRELTPTQKERLTKVLQQRYQQKIALYYRVDEALIGGAIINIAGQVIDGSIKGMLKRLKQNLL